MNIKKRTIHPVKVEQFKTTIFREILHIVDGKTLADLGAGHCSFSVIARNMGFKVTAIDARTVRVPQDLPDDIKFIESNVLDADLENYDVICILGLLYHLTLDEQIKLLNKCKNKTLVIDTHLTANSVVELKGYSGRYFKEAKNEKELFENPRAAFTTLVSFWHTYQSFYKLVENNGFNEITTIKPEHYPYRTFFICNP